MIDPQAQKVTSRHLSRKAYLYIRQSTLRQVMENQESTRRQYGLSDRAVALGWPVEQIVVIDEDQGKSGADSDRSGFGRLVAEVGQDRVGIVMGLEVSRLARNSVDWQRLLEICALTETLILDEDGIYDPAHFNDRLLLGLKGTMSEAELHVLRARLRGGTLNKARRGELPIPLPVGLTYDERHEVVLDSDLQVQGAIRSFFSTFRRTGTACATVRAFRDQGLRFPTRLRHRGGGSEVLWGELTHSRALDVLHNPRYAGAFAYGRCRTRRDINGKTRHRVLPQDEWFSLIPQSHVGYITWEAYEENRRRLKENAAAYGGDRRKSPPREGAALLQGLVICGRCGDRMTVRYRHRKGKSYPEYLCQRRGIQESEPRCQTIPGSTIDQAVGELLLETMVPEVLEIALQVQTEVETRVEQADALRGKQVERARYEVDLARRRFLRVDPENRLVADALEADWNQGLRDLAAAQEEFERQRAVDGPLLDAAQQNGIRRLAKDFPRVWGDPAVPMRERKRMMRLLVEDVTLKRDERIAVHVRLRGGTQKSLSLPLPLTAWQLRKTPPELIAEIDQLLEEHSDGEVARILDERGRKGRTGRPVTKRTIYRIRRVHGLRSHHERLRQTGLLTQCELASRLGVKPSTIKRWRCQGRIAGCARNDNGEWLYETPGPDFVRPRIGRPGGGACKSSEPVSDVTNEVQCEG